jgi:hypothetical protein
VITKTGSSSFVYELADGWSFEVSDASPCVPDPEEVGPFLVPEHAIHAARIGIEGQ